MLLSNYGRDQVGDSSFEGSQTPILHHHHHQHHQQQQQQQLSGATASEIPSLLNKSNSEQMLACQRPAGAQQQEQQRRLKPQSDQVLKCPRCDSMNTKFCYYNNYSLTQPRHFCKSCKRYWTKGGALRNVPVGGGCRKNKRVKQRQQDGSGGGHATQSSSGGATTEDITAAATDGASSSAILQQDFVPTSANSNSSYDVSKPGGGGGGSCLSPFERVSDHVSRIYSSGHSPPISINWAGQMALSSQQQTYDAAASMLGLNIPSSIKQEAGGGDLTSLFDPSLGVAAAAAAAAAAVHHHGIGGAAAPLNHEGLSYVSMENFGFGGAAPGEVLWRFPQPKLVSLLEEGNEAEAAAAAASAVTRHGHLLDLEATSGGPEKLKQQAKTKDNGMQVSSDYDQQGYSSSQEWQTAAASAAAAAAGAAPDGFFEGGGGDNSGYWGNGGWGSSDLQYGGGGGAPAAGPTQLM